MQMDQLISDPALGLTESQCLVLAKNHTLAVSNPKGTAPANVWNFCATGICNYTFANGTTGVFVSPYAGSHTASVCQLGYSSAVDNNEYLEAAVIQTPGQGNAGRGGGVLACCLTALCLCLSCWLVVFAFCVVFALAFHIAFSPFVLYFACEIAYAFCIASQTAFVVFVSALALALFQPKTCIAGSCADARCALVPSQCLADEYHTAMDSTLLCPSVLHTLCCLPHSLH